MPIEFKRKGVESLAEAHRAAARVRADLEASATAVSSWSALIPKLLRLSTEDPQASLAILAATERLVESMRAGGPILDEDDADAFGPEADARDQAEIARVAAQITSGEIPTIPYAVVKRVSEGTHRLRAWREHRGLTQAELAARANLTQGAIADIERGRRRPGMDALHNIAAALNIQPSMLMD